MQLEVVSPEQILFQKEVSSAILPGVDGLFQILNNHAPLIAVLKEGIIKAKELDGKESEIKVNNGFVEVLNNKVTVMV